MAWYRNSRSDDNDTYKFTIENGEVVAVYESSRRGYKLERMDRDETWSTDGTTVTKTEVDDGRLEVTVYTDVDGDGIFVKSEKYYEPLVDTSGTPTPTIDDDDAYETSGSDDDLVDDDDAYETSGYDDGLVDNDDTYETSGPDDGLVDNDDAYETPDYDDGLVDDSPVQTDPTPAPTPTIDPEPSPVAPVDLTDFDAVARKTYTFDVANFEVLGGTMNVGSYSRSIRLDRDESLEIIGDNIAKVETGYRDIEYTIFTDTDADGVFVEALELEVNTATSSRSYEDHQFFDANNVALTGFTTFEGDLISSYAEVSRWGWRTENLDANESLISVELDGSIYIAKQEVERDGSIEFDLFRDDDGDGLWTEVAEGEAQFSFLASASEVDFAQVQDLDILAASNSIIG